MQILAWMTKTNHRRLWVDTRNCRQIHTFKKKKKKFMQDRKMTSSSIHDVINVLYLDGADFCFVKFIQANGVFMIGTGCHFHKWSQGFFSISPNIILFRLRIQSLHELPQFLNNLIFFFKQSCTFYTPSTRNAY